MKSSSGLWQLSPSSLYKFTECRSCFWVDNHYKRAPMLPLLLNSAMDSILKHRYDMYRKKKAFPPEVKELLKERIKPFMDWESLNTWREKTSALEVVDREVGYILRGKIDDVLVEADGRLVPADYKSSGNPPGADKQKYYRDQLAAYGLMFRVHGFKVSNRAYLLHYFVRDKSDPSLDVKFDSHVDLVKMSPVALKKKLREMVKLLDGKYPGHNPECKHCAYYSGRGRKAR